MPAPFSQLRGRGVIMSLGGSLTLVRSSIALRTVLDILGILILVGVLPPFTKFKRFDLF